MAHQMLAGLSPSEWTSYVQQEGQLFLEAVRAELALTGLPVAECDQRAQARRTAQLAHELHDSLVEWGMSSAVATMAVRKITSRPPDERLRILSECAALARFLPSLGPEATGRVVLAMGTPVVASTPLRPD